jgi:glutamate-ammonia-ligase adenylyltransferase
MLLSHEPDLDRLRTGSRYIGTLLKNEELKYWLIQERSLWRRIPLPELYRELHQACTPCVTFKDLALCFRFFKQRHFVRLAGRDLFGMADFPELVSQISDLAKACLQVGVHVLASRPELWMEASGAERDAINRCASHFGVLGLGKLGGDELNFVSDIDLIFLQDNPREDYAGPGQLKMDLCRLAQALIRLLSDMVGGDRVFIVDMRLRPGGKDAEMVITVERAVAHYQIYGRSWERQALLKARPVAGQRSIGYGFLEQIRPFVFRRFLDFQALDELKAMRDRVLDQGRYSEGAPFNLKLGIGGIREIEFVIQSLQLVYGGRHPELDEANSLRCLRALCNLGLMSADAADALFTAYVLLRRVEHWVQLDCNRQTHVLPKEEADMDRLARVLDYPSGTKLSQALHDVREEVHAHFSALFRSSAPVRDEVNLSEEEIDQGEADLREIVPCPPFNRDVLRAIQHVGAKLIESGLFPDQEWKYRLSELVHKAGIRPGLAVLLNKSPVWMKDLFYSSAVSQFVSSLLLHQPSLLEGLHEDGQFELGQYWSQKAWRRVRFEHGYEQSLEWIRRLKNERMLDVAVCDIQGRLPLREVEKELTALAEWTIQVTWEAVTGQVEGGMGWPVAVLGLGKMGSREMGYLSDLDLMFVYDPREKDAEQIPAQVVKSIQRFMRMLRTPLQEGPGYVVDAQIRPSGTYGPLVVTDSRWIDYYRYEADIWEIQALLRMRAVGGDRGLGHRLEKEAAEICGTQRSQETVWPRLCQLRRRMELERSRETSFTLDLKLGPGGLADVEFLVQGAELVQGRGRQTALAVREHLEQLGPGLGLLPESVEKIQMQYQALRKLELRMQLMTNQTGSLITRDEFSQLEQSGLWPPDGIEAIIRDWNDIQVARREIRKVWETVCAG